MSLGSPRGRERRADHTGEDGEEEEGLRCRGQSVPRRPAVPDAGGAPLAILAPNHLMDGLELAVALMWELSRGAAGGAGASEDRPTAVVLHGAIAPQDGGGFQGRTECKSKMDAQAL
jgi:hypothetical protein